MNKRIHDAIIYAGRRHSKQLRKGTDIPYLVHPMEVMGILIENSCSDDVIIAGILHDVIEDTCDDNDEIRDSVRKEIKEKFGQSVLEIVDCESEDKSKTWKERKQHTIDALKNESLEVRLVCCADKLSNILSIKADKELIGEKIFDRFNAPKSDLKWYYSSVAENLNLKEYEMYSQYVKTVNEVFGE